MPPKAAAKPATGMLSISSYFTKKPAAPSDATKAPQAAPASASPAKPAASLISPPPPRKAEPSSATSSATSSGARERPAKTLPRTSEPAPEPKQKAQPKRAKADEDDEEDDGMLAPRRKRLVKRAVVDSDEEADAGEEDVTPAKRLRNEEPAAGAGKASPADAAVSPARAKADPMEVDLTASSPEDASPSDGPAGKAKRRPARAKGKGKEPQRGGGESSGSEDGGEEANAEEGGGAAGPSGGAAEEGQFKPDLAKRSRFKKILGPGKAAGAARAAAAAEGSEGAPRARGVALSGERYTDILARAREKKSGYTPLEVQWLEVKAAHPDTVLFLECGYKFKFLDRDAEVAARVLSIFASHDKHFRTASIPVHRLTVHARRLVEAGYKVGVIRQMETAALKKAGENKSGVFQRELAALYTKGTLIGDGLDPLSSGSGAEGGAGLARYIVCCCEERASTVQSALEEQEKVVICLVAVDAGTGDVVFDRFQDGMLRGELETRLRYLQPVEVVVPERGQLSSHTEKLLRLAGAFEEDGEPPAGGVRLERYPSADFAYAAAVERLSALFAAPQEGREKGKGAALELQEALQMPQGCVRCVGVLARHLAAFGLSDVLRLPASPAAAPGAAPGAPFRHFSSRTSMLLSASALANLEILRNSTDGSERGSLAALLASQRGGPQTAFGARQLRAWVTRPLLQRGEIVARQEAVQELLEGALAPLLEALRNLPDLERGLARIAYRKIVPSEFSTLMNAFLRLARAAPEGPEPASALLREWADGEMLRAAGRAAEEALGRLDARAASKNEKEALFGPSLEEWPEVAAAVAEIAETEEELAAELQAIRKKLQRSDLEWTKVNGEEYTIELGKSEPAVGRAERAGYQTVVTLAKVSRFRSPLVANELLPRMQRAREGLQIAAERAWAQFLTGLAEGPAFPALRALVRNAAHLDAAAALAACARLPGYVRPSIADPAGGQQLVVRGGRHPMVEAAMAGAAYVPNDVELRADGPRCLILTGPNMGGKSSYIRQTALLVVLAQIGAWVPADECTLTPFDAVHTRMGASDDIGKGLSTFMVELQEASAILRAATRRSLVILDELGRGTSTHDGTAIAFATLRHLVASVQCATLFVTHYPLVGALERELPGRVLNAHMAFLEAPAPAPPPPPPPPPLPARPVPAAPHAPAPAARRGRGDGQQKQAGLKRVTFLYKVTRGLAERSYGLNVARLAHLPAPLLATAARKAAEMEAATAARAPARGPEGPAGAGAGEEEAGPLETGFREAFLAVEGPPGAADLRAVLARLREGAP
eukprot:tig00021616_g22915.t1